MISMGNIENPTGRFKHRKGITNVFLGKTGYPTGKYLRQVFYFRKDSSYGSFLSELSLNLYGALLFR